MASRLELHEELCGVLGKRNVYFQPPSSISMKYPCIRYSKSGKDLKRADNQIYQSVNRYEGVVIDSNPDSEIPDRLLEHFQMCTLDRVYTANNLHHYSFTIYY